MKSASTSPKATRWLHPAWFSLVAVLASSCATLGSEGLGDVGLPSSGVGPFRRLTTDEVPGIAPFVLDGEGGYREPAVLSDDASEPLVTLYAGATGAGRDGVPKGPVIVRSFAKDGRSFVGSGGGPGRGTSLVLAPSEAWEGGEVGSPYALRVGVVSASAILLFYAGAQGIGVAKATSSEGPFVKTGAPVLDANGASGWESEPPRAPTAYLDGRTIHLFFASGGSLGEAVADVDALAFRRVDADPSTVGIDPVLSPSAPVDPKTLAVGEKPPFDEAGLTDPCVAVRVTPAGRAHVRVLYTGKARAGTTAIGFAARYGHQGVLVRQAVPVYAAKGKERAPALLDLGDRGYLYFTQPRSSDAREGIGGGYFPAQGKPGPLVPAD